MCLNVGLFVSKKQLPFIRGVLHGLGHVNEQTGMSLPWGSPVFPDPIHIHTGTPLQKLAPVTYTLWCPRRTPSLQLPHFTAIGFWNVPWEPYPCRNPTQALSFFPKAGRRRQSLGTPCFRSTSPWYSIYYFKMSALWGQQSRSGPGLMTSDRSNKNTMWQHSINTSYVSSCNLYNTLR